MRRSVFILLTLFAVLPMRAQQDWEPIGTWPFEYKNFRTAIVYTGFFKVQSPATFTWANKPFGSHAMTH